MGMRLCWRGSPHLTNKAPRQGVSGAGRPRPGLTGWGGGRQDEGLRRRGHAPDGQQGAAERPLRKFWLRGPTMGPLWSP